MWPHPEIRWQLKSSRKKTKTATEEDCQCAQRTMDRNGSHGGSFYVQSSHAYIKSHDDTCQIGPEADTAPGASPRCIQVK